MRLDQLVGAFEAHHRALGHSQDTIDHYTHSLSLFSRFLDDAGIDATKEALTSATMNLFAGWLRETPVRQWRGKTERSIYGIHGALKDVKVFVRWLAGEAYLDKVPKVPVPRLPQRLFPILSDAELDRVFACELMAGRSEQATRNCALISLMLDTGVRLAETAGIALDDLDLRGRAVRIRGKGNKERLVYFSDGVADALKRFLAIRGLEAGTLFWLSTDGIRMVYKRIANQVGLAVFTPHQVRHTALTSMLKQGMDLHTIKRLAGHASVTTTESYLALAGEDIKTKHAAASPVDRVRARATPLPKPRRRFKPS